MEAKLFRFPSDFHQFALLAPLGKVLITNLPVSIPVFDNINPDFARHGRVHWQGSKGEAVF